MSTYRGADTCTDLLLDFISEHESRGNYNAVIDNAGSAADLSDNTLDDIYSLMEELLARGHRSTAVGRYQIIRGTLQALQRGQRLTGNTLFTPRLQDDLAIALMVKRGYSKWWRGEISNEGFAHGLSCEWASLPDPLNGGKSHYDGDRAGNHAAMPLSTLYDVLWRARETWGTPIVVPLAPPPEPVAVDPAAPLRLFARLLSRIFPMRTP